MRASLGCVLILGATLAALALRLPALDRRPMHGDEAVHAYKSGELLEDHSYRYDPNEFHGPTLNYLTLIPAWLGGKETYAELDEFTLRVVPVFFGVLLVLLLGWIGKGLGWEAAVCAGVLTAISPAMVFYSRYYIQEMLLVCFTFGVMVCGYRYFQYRKTRWALLTGLFLGLMNATKETCVIAYGSMAAALVMVLLFSGKEAGSLLAKLWHVKKSHVALFLLTALAVSSLFFSSFLSNPRGVLDSILTYETYFHRAGHNPIHDHPWYYYLRLLAFYQYGDGPVFSEGLILLLAMIGFGVAMAGKGPSTASVHLRRFIGFYTWFMVLIYSAIPYKTPWSMLGFLHGLILLAGVGAAALLRMKTPILKFAFTSVIVIGVGLLSLQAYTGSFKYDADSRNPYVYAHTSRDVFQIADRVKEMASAHEQGREMPIEVIFPDGDYWPLPWYLRGYHVGYYSEVDMETKPAPLILIDPSLESELMKKLYELPPPGQKEMYMRLFYQNGKTQYLELRPGVPVQGFVAKSLWDRFQNLRYDTANELAAEPADAEPKNE